MSEISDTLLKRRLRNRLMEFLDAFADDQTVSAVGTDEIIETWYDYMDDNRLNFYDEPVFSVEEINAIKRFKLSPAVLLKSLVYLTDNQ